MKGEGALPSHMEPRGLFLEQEDAAGRIQLVCGEGIDPLPKPDEPSALHIASGPLWRDFLFRQDLNVKGNSMREARVEWPD
jgi:hypothetical protein